MNTSDIVISVGIGVMAFMVCLAVKEILFLLKEDMKDAAKQEARIALSETEARFFRFLQIHEMTEHGKKVKK